MQTATSWDTPAQAGRNGAARSQGGYEVLRAVLIRAGESAVLRRQVTRNRLARRVAGRFIAGDTLDDAERVVRRLTATGASVALDYLGEHTTSEVEAARAAACYVAALDRIQEAGLDANVSVKLTALGIDLAPGLAVEEASKVCVRAKQAGAMVGIDMESHEYVDRTLATVDALRRRFGGERVGVCLQSYLHRTPADLERLNGWEVPVRLVKGAYDEPAEVAHPGKADVDRAYAELLDRLLDANPYPMIATHDPRLIRRAKQLAGARRRGRTTFEFQMLHGIRRDLQRQVVAEGYRLRVYVPYGDQWFPYFMRRLAERPANLGFFLSSLVRR
jgi:proline dehydrogenase